MTTPVCKSCGSVRMARNLETRKMECQEPDCAEVSRQRTHGLTSRNHRTNTGWRDPVALSMDGYE